MIFNATTLAQELTYPKPWWSVYFTSFKLWLKTLVVIYPIALILAILTNVFAQHFFTDPGISTVNLSLDAVSKHWYLVPIYLLIPEVFVALMYNYLDNVFFPNKEPQRPFLHPFYRIGTLFMVMLFSLSSLIFGLFLLIIPGIIISVILQFYVPIVILDKLNFYQGFTKSFDLIWGHWWRTAIILVIPLMVYYAFLTYLEPWAVRTLHLASAHEIFFWNLFEHIFCISIFLTYMICIIYTQLYDLKHRKNVAIGAVGKTMSYILSIW